MSDLKHTENCPMRILFSSGNEIDLPNTSSTPPKGNGNTNKKIQERVSLFSPVRRIIGPSVNIETQWTYGFALSFVMFH